MESVLNNFRSEFGNFGSRFQIGLLFVVTLLLGIILEKQARYWKYNLPPGPFSWPIIGHQPFIPPQKDLYYQNLAKKYGKIFSLYLGDKLTIILNDYELIREACNKDSMAARPPHSFEFIPGSPSIGDLNGPEWKEQRQFLLRSFRDLGMGKTEGAAVSARNQNDLIASFVRRLAKEDGRPMRVKDALTHETNNLIFKMITGTSFDEDTEMSRIVNLFQSSSQRYLQANQKKYFYPLLGPILNYLDSRIRNGRRNMSQLYNALDTEVSKHEENLVVGDQTDLIDCYLHEMSKRTTKSFTRQSLLANSSVLLVAGSEATQMSLEWMFMYAAKYPSVQERVYGEIMEVVGKERMPEWSDSPFMPFTLAVFWEVMRYVNLIPVNEARWVLEDEKLGGYDIPKGASVEMVFNTVHKDPKIWDDPEVFRPERFLSKDGKSLNELIDKVFVFSKGKRNCPGEGLARVNIFLYFAAVLQVFKVQAPKEGLNDKVSQVLGVRLDNAVFVFQSRN